jgi:acetylornithine deacetylase
MRNLSPAELAVVGAVDRDRVVDDLQALVRIPSLTGDEGEVQTEVALRMATAGLQVERVDTPLADLARDPAFPGIEVERELAPVVAGRIGRPGGRRVIVSGHVDVVSAGDLTAWPVDPWAAELRDGCVWGRGSLDMKAGVVAGLAALRAIVATGTELPGEALLVSVPGEEDGGSGTFAAVRAGYVGDAAVITEPTNLTVVTATAGAITFRLRVPGRPAHAAFRRDGVSAIEKFILLHEALAADERARNEAETLPNMRAIGLPYPTLVGRVEAGEWSSTVPELLVAEGRYGVRIGQTPAEAESELRAAIDAAAQADPWLAEHPPVVEITGGRFASAAIANTDPLPWGLAGAARDVLGRLPDFVGVPYGADARLFVHEGDTPCVLYGPGDPRLAHTPEERVPIDDVVHCARTLAVWVMRALAA